jgi:hypothetical protein
MEESLGSVRPFNGDQGRSRGVFQIQHWNPSAGSFDAATCFNSAVGSCSTSDIRLMVRQGICGFALNCQYSSRPGIASYWHQYNGSVGLTAQGYNSGSVYDEWDLTVTDVGTNSYASDIVNRAMGTVTGGFFSRTCCAKCTRERIAVEVRTCGGKMKGGVTFVVMRGSHSMGVLADDDRSKLFNGVGRRLAGSSLVRPAVLTGEAGLPNSRALIALRAFSASHQRSLNSESRGRQRHLDDTVKGVMQWGLFEGVNGEVE